MQFFEDHAGFISFIALVATVLMGGQAYLRAGPLSDLKEKIATPKSRDALRQSIRTGRHQTYFNAIETVTAWANRFYGDRLISFKAFERCLMLAFCYPLPAILISWIGWNLYAPGGLPLFADLQDFDARLWRGLLMTLATAAMFPLMLRYEAIAERIDQMVAKLYRGWARQGAQDGPVPGWVSGTSFVIYLVICGTFGVVGAFAFGFAGALVFAATVTVAGVIVGGASATVVIGSIVAGTGAAYATGVGTLNVTIDVFFLYALLPVCNAAADLGSVAATRFFLRRIDTIRPGLGGIVLGVLVDLCVGLGFLALLILLLTQALDLWAGWSPETVPLDWRAYWDGVKVAPATGLPLYLMLATTLLPTALHLVAGLGAVFTQRSRLNARALRALDRLSASGDAPEPAECTAIAKQVLGARLYGWGLALGLLVLLVCAATYLPWAWLPWA